MDAVVESVFKMCLISNKYFPQAGSNNIISCKKETYMHTHTTRQRSSELHCPFEDEICMSCQVIMLVGMQTRWLQMRNVPPTSMDPYSPLRSQRIRHSMHMHNTAVAVQQSWKQHKLKCFVTPRGKYVS